MRWGDERTYTDAVLPEPVAFMGVPQRSVIVVSTYGCIRGGMNKNHFQAGLENMVDYLQPQLVLVHGAMPQRVFAHVLSKAEFIQFPSWITRMKAGE